MDNAVVGVKLYAHNSRAQSLCAVYECLHVCVVRPVFLEMRGVVGVERRLWRIKAAYIVLDTSVG